MDDGRDFSPKSFNPLDKASLAKSLADALGSVAPVTLPPPRFSGAGVYALYYNGAFRAYSLLVEKDRGRCEYPIYIGKAAPPGTRKGVAEAEDNKALFSRLSQHASSVRNAEGLDVRDFSCRLMVVDDIWISLAEATLIRRFQPVWNIILDGFGNHAPGKGRAAGKISKWDIMHSGRPWIFDVSKRAAPGKEQEEEAARRRLTNEAMTHLEKFFKDRLGD
ncbi:MAG: Eco29kI family restriction endonuclease [Deltaproteobacteria bacterium]|jgi:hypothetical protein|nr:Eco29kI family restriction endonuclease [Deltaproteobacteria bacterium]